MIRGENMVVLFTFFIGYYAWLGEEWMVIHDIWFALQYSTPKKKESSRISIRLPYGLNDVVPVWNHHNKFTQK